MKIPFDIKFRPQIESGEYKIETTKGQPVRIICWDRSTTYWKIIGLVLAPDGKTENPFTYDVNGKESDGCLHNYEFDLFITTPEPKLSEFELKVQEILYADKQEYSASDPESWKRASFELLAIARKEIENEAPSIIHAQSFNAGLKHGKEKALKEFETKCQVSSDIVHGYAYGLGFKAGNAEALKNLPRWKRSKPESGRNYVLMFKDGSVLNTTDFRKDGKFYYEDGESYNDIRYNDNCVMWMYLDELLQLPGFEEDESHE